MTVVEVQALLVALVALWLLWRVALFYFRLHPRRRPAIALEHDAAWKGPLGRARRKAYAATHERRCVRCGASLPDLHHKLYMPGCTGHEPDSVFAYLCPRRCHPKVHARHDALFPLDRWPYRRLRWVTDWTIRTGRLWWGLWRRLPDWEGS